MPSRSSAGEVFGFLGPNGAGKTTTIRTLLDLLHPTSGTARLFGLDSRRDSRAIRARVGNLPASSPTTTACTGRELLKLFAALRGLPGAGGARSLAERFEADLSRPLGELSRGNRQKIGLIQALFHEPELLILDEPTAGLDPLMQEEFLEVVAEHRDRGATVFLSSHDLDEVERVCDRVGIIREGRLVDVEAVEDMRGRAYRNVVARFEQPVAAGEFERLAGVHDVAFEGTTVRFRVLRRPRRDDQGDRPPPGHRRGDHTPDARRALPDLLRPRGQGVSVSVRPQVAATRRALLARARWPP